MPVKNGKLKDRTEMIFAMLSELDLERLSDLVIKDIPQIVQTKGCSIFLWNETYEDFELHRTSGLVDFPEGRIAYKPGEGLTGWVCQHGKPLRIRNVRNKDELKKFASDLSWEKKCSEIKAEKGFAFLAVPLISSKNVVLGVIRLSRKLDPTGFTNGDEILLVSVASKVSQAIENASLYKLEKQRGKYLSLLNQIGIEISAILDIEKLLEIVAERAAKTFSAETSEIYLTDDVEPNRLVMRAGYCIPEHLINRAELSIGEGITGWIVETGKKVRSENVLALPQYKGKYRDEIAPHLKHGNRLTFIGLPLKCRGKVLGVLKLYNKIAPEGMIQYFTEEDERYLEILADEVSVALENARYLQSLHDIAVKALQVQRLTSLGTLAVRLPAKVENSLSTARLAVDNLARAVSSRFSEDPESSKWLKQKLENICQPLKEVDENIDLLRDYSSKAGFVKSFLDWPNLLDQSLLLVKGTIIIKKVEVERKREKEEELPRIFVEPSEIMEVLTTILHTLLYSMKYYGGRITIESGLSRDRNYLTLKFKGEDGDERSPISGNTLVVKGIMNDHCSPFRFALDVARNIVETEYHGRLVFKTNGERKFTFVLDIKTRKE